MHSLVGQLEVANTITEAENQNSNHSSDLEAEIEAESRSDSGELELEPEPRRNVYIPDDPNLVVLENGEIVTQESIDAKRMRTESPSSNAGDPTHEELNNYLTVLSHQMALIMKKLDVKPCACDNCKPVAKRHNANSRKRSVPSHHPYTASLSAQSSRKTSTNSVDVLKIIQAQKADYEKIVEKQLNASEVPTSTASTSTPQLSALNTPAGTPFAVQTPEILYSPDFLQALQQQTHCATVRGRGRGRPMLIGDELHNNLVDFLVNYEMSNSTRLYPSQAIKMATDFIRQKQPGLLAEDGGSIVLKMTWAMKLVTHVRSRKQKFTELINRTFGDKMTGEASSTGTSSPSYSTPTENALFVNDNGGNMAEELKSDSPDMSYTQLMAFLHQSKSE
uniref:BEN domain-containing protein n=1 Tax=Steinernema glaseri TaxID=37863 RepID=A0A1I7Y696_9BILA